MSQIINPMIFGGADEFPLIFKDGHIEKIPMEKVHINMSGVDPLDRSLYYPIIAQSKQIGCTRDGIGYIGLYISYGVLGDNSTLSATYNYRNDKQHNTWGVVLFGYCPICVNSFENLQNGKFIYSGDAYSIRGGAEKWYVYAEK